MAGGAGKHCCSYVLPRWGFQGGEEGGPWKQAKETGDREEEKARVEMAGGAGKHCCSYVLPRCVLKGVGEAGKENRGKGGAKRQG